MTPFSEDGRQIVHVGTGSLALLLPYANWWDAAAVAGLAVAFNAYALPRFANGRIYRPSEARGRFTSGVTLYPLAVLLLILILPDRLDIVAAAWGVLAFGDGMASIVGRHFGGPEVPWNPGKTAAGSLAFVLFGGTAGAFLCWWCRPILVPPPYLWYSVGIPFLAAAAAAAVETVPIGLDDNLSVPATAAGVLWWASLINEDAVVSLANAALPLWPLALAVNAAVAAAAWKARTLTVSGAVCGAAIGSLIVLATGWGGWALLSATFVMAVTTSRLGWRRKSLLGIAEGREGRRGGGNAFANTGVAAGAAFISAVSYVHDPAILAFVAALAAGGSDTMASELGKAWGRRTFLFPTFRRVPAGTPGAVSVVGTAAGLTGAVALALVGVGTGLMSWPSVLPVTAGATIGAFAESGLGAHLENRGIVNNDVLNFLNTAIAAAAAVLIAKAMQ